MSCCIQHILLICHKHALDSSRTLWKVVESYKKLWKIVKGYWTTSTCSLVLTEWRLLTSNNLYFTLCTNANYSSFLEVLVSRASNLLCFPLFYIYPRTFQQYFVNYLIKNISTVLLFFFIYVWPLVFIIPWWETQDSPLDDCL